MKAWLAGLAVALAAVLTGCATVRVPAPQPSEVVVMTYNIRLDLASDGANAWPYRKAMVSAIVRREGPGVIGLQEVLHHQKQDLEAALPDYAFHGVGRDDGLDAGEFSPLAWRRARFELVDSGTFWLSPLPDQPGKGWDAAYPRIATWALLRDKVAGRTVRVLNTHFDHVGNEAKRRSAELIARWAEDSAFRGVPTIVMGDFNSVPGSAPFVRLASAAGDGLHDTRTASRTPPFGPPGTYNGFDIARRDPAPIDHVFVSQHWAVERHATITQHWEGRLPSDHYPVAVHLILKR